jgi:cellulose synthase (UDP-forming)
MTDLDDRRAVQSADREGSPIVRDSDIGSRFIEVGTARQQLVFRGLSVLWLVSIVVGVAWWVSPTRAGTGVGMAINSAVLAFDAVVLPAWFLFFTGRMRRPDPAIGLPTLRVAMVVTKAPSEQWALVRVTLNAMLTQDYPGGYDVWLADEHVSPQARDWCRQRGVRICTRDGVSAYHQRSWPRRTRCKEGNLAFFYDIWGYRLYDVVAQLDADHVPAQDYLRHIVAPFADPSVGYVAAPSICDSNVDRSWSARGRLYAEALIHGPIQAGSNGGWAPCCIGSHYAVRTSALKQIGGLGPELAEDFSTSLLMCSHGWKGVFALNAQAHGDGPESITDCVTQDFQWSRSMMMIALTIGLRELRRASWRAKIKLGFCLAWYPIYSVVMLTSVVLPAAALLSGIAPVRVELYAFYAHLLPSIAVLIVAAYWLRRCGALRPSNAKVIGWEIVLFELIRWPWALLGCLHALAGWIARREFNFKVTPKGSASDRPLPLRVMIPFLALSMLSALPALLVQDAGQAGGYYVWTLVNAVLYAVVAGAIVILHVHEQRHALRMSLLRSMVPKALAVATASLLAAAAVTVNGAAGLRAITYHEPAKSAADTDHPPPPVNPLRHAAKSQTWRLARPRTPARQARTLP